VKKVSVLGKGSKVNAEWCKNGAATGWYRNFELVATEVTNVSHSSSYELLEIHNVPVNYKCCCVVTLHSQ
jgi:hypothetical protein